MAQLSPVSTKDKEINMERYGKAVEKIEGEISERQKAKRRRRTPECKKK